MALKQRIYRLIGLDGRPHKVLDTPYESIDAAIGDAENWCKGENENSLLGDRSIGVEVKTTNGSWRTICYQNCSVNQI
tara:strand:- start:625 stop:858 length:234 start_codon:yes stop_codon:yes gene_type:complete